MGLNLYLLTQDKNNGYDAYDSCVVAADSPEEAALIDPRGNIYASDPHSTLNGWSKGTFRSHSTWVESPADVKVKLVGTAVEGVHGVVCASFNAG